MCEIIDDSLNWSEGCFNSNKMCVRITVFGILHHFSCSVMYVKVIIVFLQNFVVVYVFQTWLDLTGSAYRQLKRVSLMHSYHNIIGLF